MVTKLACRRRLQCFITHCMDQKFRVMCTLCALHCFCTCAFCQHAPFKTLLPNRTCRCWQACLSARSLLASTTCLRLNMQLPYLYHDTCMLCCAMQAAATTHVTQASAGFAGIYYRAPAPSPAPAAPQAQSTPLLSKWHAASSSMVLLVRCRFRRKRFVMESQVQGETHDLVVLYC